MYSIIAGIYNDAGDANNAYSYNKAVRTSPEEVQFLKERADFLRLDPDSPFAISGFGSRVRCAQCH